MAVVGSYIVDNNLGDYASVVGLFVSIVGFFLTVLTALRAKSAALRAEEEVIKAREALLRYDAIGEVSAALAAIDEIKRHHRESAWRVLPDLYAKQRSRLIRLRASAGSTLTARIQIELQNSITNLRAMERSLDLKLAGNATPPEAAAWNAQLSDDSDWLNEALQELRG